MYLFLEKFDQISENCSQNFRSIPSDILETLLESLSHFERSLWSTLLQSNSMKTSTWMWKSNFRQSIDNLVSLESINTQLRHSNFNFLKQGQADFLLIGYEILTKTKILFFLVFILKFQKTVNFFWVLTELGN